MVDLNADVGTIIKNLLGKGGAAKAVPVKKASGGAQSSAMRKVVLVGSIALMATAAYIQFYYLPQQKKLMEKVSELETTQKMKSELAGLDEETTRLQKMFSEDKTKYHSLIDSFGNNGKVQELYRAISNIATAHSLVVLNIRAADAEGTLLQDIVTEKVVNVELQGRFQQFVAFRKKLMLDKPMLSVKSEAIEMGSQEQPGKITIRLVLLDYSINKAAFKEVLDHGQ